MKKRFLIVLLAMFFASVAAGLDATAQREYSIGRGNVGVALTVSPAAISLATDFELTLDVAFPENLDTALPQDFTDRFEGLTLEGTYESEPFSVGGQRHRTLHLRTRPIPGAPRYRLAPFAVRTKPVGLDGNEDWFPTKAVLFDVAPILRDGDADPEAISENLDIIRVRPSFKFFARIAGYAASAVGAVAVLFLLIKAIRRRVKIAGMNPRERALLELSELLKRALPDKGRTKQFYVELTKIVRRYIERRHGIKAPEQTTDEFLEEAMRHPAFPKETLSSLREFLDAADLVKFAGIEASSETVGNSVRTAKTYLENEPKKEAEVRL